MSSRDARAWGRRRTTVPSTTVTLDDSVTMPVTPDVAWHAMQDIEKVAACIPGLVPGSVEQIGPDTFRGSMRHLALGIPSLWLLEAHVHRSEPERSLTVHLDGKEERLGLTLEGDVQLSVGSGTDRGAALAYVGELTITGRLAGAGGPIVERVVASIVERFVERVGSGGLEVKRPWWERLASWMRARASLA